MFSGCGRTILESGRRALRVRRNEPGSSVGYRAQHYAHAVLYVDLSTLALTLPKQQLTLQKSTAEQRLVWEMLSVLDKAQRKERDQDVARSL